MANQQIIFPSASVEAGGVTLAFVKPAIGLSFYESKGVRFDDYDGLGDKESIFIRADHFITFDMPRIVDGGDAQAWQVFLDWAIQGLALDFYPDSASNNQFLFYPNAPSGGYATCYWESTGAKLMRRAPGLWKLSQTARLRLVPPAVT
jgi:hypothetical protein